MAVNVSRRQFLQAFAVASTGALAAACSAAPAASPTAVPAPKVAAPAPPAAPPQSAPGQTAPAQTGQAAPSGGQAAWDALVDAARKEGKVVIKTPVGAGYREGVDAFMRAYPGIEAELQSFPDGATYVPKIQGERKAGIYSFDVGSTTVVPVLQILKGEGTFDPLKPVIIHPEALDDKAWYKGLDGRWADITKSHVFKHQFSANRAVYINTNLVEQGEVKELDDLLDPKWKGKIVTSDLIQGYVYTPSTIIREIKGEDWLRRLFVGQEPQIIRDRRQTVETLVRGGASIAFGLHPLVLNEFVRDGLADHIKPVDMPGAGSTGGEVIVLFNRAPHPNAAKLFVNWQLSKEGQTAWSQALQINSARLDVPPIDPSLAPGKVDYGDATQEEVLHKVGETQEFLKSLM